MRRMNAFLPIDEDLARRLPLPLAQLYRRAHNAKTPLERHLTAFYLWEAALKLLGSAAIAEYAAAGELEPELSERLQNLARPSLGHWWEFVRRLLPVLADRGDAGFGQLRDWVLGKTRDDLPRAAGLDAVLREALDGQAGARATVRLTELFDRLVQYRNRELGHGAAGRRPAAFYERMGAALVAGVAEVLARLDVLAGRWLLYVPDVRRKASGDWLVERFELQGEAGRRIESLVVPEAEARRLPRPECLYLETPAGEGRSPLLRLLHPLAVHDADGGEVLFLNARRGQKRTEYLSYTTGRVLDRPDLGNEHRDFMARILGTSVTDGQVEQWASRSHAEESPPDAPVLEPRRQIGEFELLSILGRGGMGVVYRAWQPSLGRQVAVKELLKTGDAKAEARFAREVRALGKVEHPHLVKVFTSGADGDRWFYAMELVEGAPLAVVCARLQARSPNRAGVSLPTWEAALSTACEELRRAEKSLSDVPTKERDAESRQQASDHPPTTRNSPLTKESYVHHIVSLIRDVAGAAHALHEAGVVHRDIKPGNIMVSNDGTHAVLMDLGLAQLADDVEGRLTRTRQFVGTLRYASPEQVLAVGGLDRRSDIYSLGATLWELLTLRPLYGADEQTPTPELMRRIQYTEPGRLRLHNPAIPADLDAIVQKCLEKDPARRYANAGALAEELGRFLDGAPVEARPVSELARAWRWCRRRPALAAAYGLLAVVGVLLLAGSGALWFWRSAEVARRDATQARDRLARLSYMHRIGLAQQNWEVGEALRARHLLEGCEEKWRGWEWHFLSRLLHPELFTLHHAEPVSSVAFSPDGNWLASGSWDGMVKVHVAATGQEVFTFPGDGNRIYSVAFSSDGRHLAAGNADGTAKIWDTRTRQLTRTLKGHTDAISGVVFSSDGTRLATGGWDNTIKVWQAATGQELLSFQAHGHGVASLAYSPDARLLASGGGDGSVRVWDANTGREQNSVRVSTKPVSSVAFSPDGTRLAAGAADDTVKVWEPSHGRKAMTLLLGHTGPVACVAFSRDGDHLATGSWDSTVRVWNIQTGREESCLRGHTGLVFSVAFSSDGHYLASGGWDNTVKVWQRAGKGEVRTLKGHGGPVNSLAFSPDGKLLASGGDDGAVKIWDLVTGREVRTLLAHSEPVLSVAFSPDGRWLASGGKDHTPIIWDTSTWREVHRLPAHSNLIIGVAFSSNGKWLATASYDGTVMIWDPSNGRELRALPHMDGVTSLAFSPNSQFLATASCDNSVRVWETDEWREALVLAGHTAPVNSLAFSANGSCLASAGSDQMLKLWDLGSGKEVITIPDTHRGPVYCLVFSPDDRYVVSGGQDNFAKLWEATLGEEVLILKGHTAGISGLAFSPDGLCLASAGQDSTVILWDAAHR
jgi:WD40 repeat protein/serine/threonine protein kinase